MQKHRLTQILACLFVAGTTIVTPAQTTDRVQLAAKIESLGQQLKELEMEYLRPVPADLKKNAAFLETPGRGVIRLLERPDRDTKRVVMLSGGGAYYSFTRLTHEYGYGSDIELQHRIFSVGFAGADFGVLADLGENALEGLTLESPGVRFLATWPTPVKLSEARLRQRLCSDGFQEDGFLYNRNVGASVGRTYALRSVSYDRSDVLVGFTVTRSDIDGSMILIWKMLKEFPGPVLMRDKVE